MMKLIAHRGNINGANRDLENTPDHIDTALRSFFDVEVDFWMIEGKFFLGHDSPDTEIDYQWLYVRQKNLWIHCKNAAALEFCQLSGWHHFWHNTDQYTLTSEKIVWAYPTAFPIRDCIIAVPELFHGKDGTVWLLKGNHIKGICTDFPLYYKSLLPEVNFT